LSLISFEPPNTARSRFNNLVESLGAAYM